MMPEPLASNGSRYTLETQEVINIKRKLLAPTGESECFAIPHSRVRGTPPPPLQSQSHHDSNTNAAPFDFTFATQSSRRAATVQDFSPPRLVTSKSLPTTDLVDNERVKVENMHYTFAHYPEGPGDTQPVDTQTFVQHSDLGLRQSAFISKQAPAEDGGAVIADTAATRMGLDHAVNLEQELVEIDDDVLSIGSIEDELSPESELRVQSHTRALFKLPQTPATVSRKRSHNGELISFDIRTSSTKEPASVIKAMFGGKIGADNDISMTQLFRNTQMASSPLPNERRSDPVFERPSPNLHFQQSSPRIFPVSSPIRPSTSDGIRHTRYTNIEPVSVYRTMKESQESRAARFQEEERKRMIDVLGEDEEDEFDDDTWTCAHNRRKKHEFLRTKAATSTIRLTAPPRLKGRIRISSTKQARSRSMVDLSSDRHIISDAKLLITRLISSDPVTDTLDSLNHTDLLDADYEDELAADEAGQLGTAPVLENRVQVPMTSSKPLRRSQNIPTQTPDSRLHGPELDCALTQKTVAVQDSQTELERPSESNVISQGIAIPSSAIPKRHVQSPSASQINEVRVSTSQKLQDMQEGRKAVLIQLSSLAASTDEIPSSPPLLPTQGTGYAEDSADELAGAEKDLLPTGPSQPKTTSENGKAELMLDINDQGDSACETATDDAHGPTSSSTRANSHIRGPHVVPASSGTTIFETAKTNQTPPQSGRAQQLAQLESNPPFSPVRRLADIAAEPSPRRSYESFNMDFDILTDGDRQYLDIMSGSSPVRPSKRPKLYGRNRSILREPAMRENTTGESVIQATKVAKITTIMEQEQDSAADSSLSVESPHSPQRTRVLKARAQVSIREKDWEETRITSQARVVATSRRADAAKIKSSRPKNSRSGLSRDAIVPTTESTRGVSNNTRKRMPIIASENEHAVTATEPLSIRHVPTLGNPVHVQHRPAIAPNRVLALFKDMKLCFYPATWLESVSTPDGEKFKVRFDDNTIAVVDPMQIRRFELVVGDSVKVDLDGMRKGTYIVHDFDTPNNASTTEGDASNAFTDAYAHDSVQLIHRSNEGLATPATRPAEPVTVPVTRLYLTGGMLRQFINRQFTVPSLHSHRFATPSVTPSELTTPGSRSRRHGLPAPAVEADLSTRKTESDLFANMSFAATFVKDLEGKEAVNKLITMNGGTLLDGGFHELFESRAADPTSPKKSPRKPTTTQRRNETKALRLQPGAQNFGFAALISDRHCRSQKYLQALALGIPCLHHRWLTDCIRSATVLPFERYLLPAGESDFLSGAVRSRHLIPCDPCGDDAKLDNVLKRRQLLFPDANVLLVMCTMERRKAYQFLAYALGAKNVKAVKHVDEERTAKWDWVFVDGDVEKVRSSFASGKVDGGNTRKGKRGSDNKDWGLAPKVVDSEFVVQSLILGALADY